MKSNSNFLNRLPFLIVPGVLLILQSSAITFLGSFLIFAGLIPFFRNPAKITNQKVKIIIVCIACVLIAALAYYTLFTK